MFGLRATPLTPPLSDHGSVKSGISAINLELPGFGKVVEPGLKVMGPVDHPNGLILENNNVIR